MKYENERNQGIPCKWGECACWDNHAIGHCKGVDMSGISGLTWCDSYKPVDQTFEDFPFITFDLKPVASEDQNE